MAHKTPREALKEIQIAAQRNPMRMQPKPGSLVDVCIKACAAGLRSPDLTPVQLVADKLQDCAERCLIAMNGVVLPDSNGDIYTLRDELRALLAPLRPAVPPTLNEALDVLRSVTDELDSRVAYNTVGLEAARALLARVPK